MNDADSNDETFISSRKSRYKDEDVRPTRIRELHGWYSYGMAVEVFTILGPGSFLPVTLEQLARERGVLASDKTTPCLQSVKAEPVRIISRAVDESHDGKEQCIVQLLGSEISTASFAMYTFSIAVFIQALMLISIGSVADHGDYRKRMLLAFAFVGALAAMLFLFIDSSIYLLGSLLAIIAIISLGCSNVMLNSFLPLLVSNHPSLSQHDTREYNDSELPPSSPIYSSTTSKTCPEMQLSNKISSRGIGLGYAAAMLMQVTSIIVLYILRKTAITTSKSFPLRFILFLSGLWWFIFTIPAALWLRKRPGPPLPSALTHKDSINTKSRLQSVLKTVSHAWSQLYTNLLLALRLPTLRRFLLSWFLLSDAIATTGNVAILFARTQLHLSPTSIAFLTITFTLSGLTGSLLLWPFLTHRFNLSTTRAILLSTCLMGIVPIYGSLYYLPTIRSLGVGGLQQKWEIFPLAVVHGLALGGLNSFCRSLYGQLIPVGREAGFYAIFAVADKGSSALGPAIVGIVVDKSGLGIRGAFWVLLILVGGGLWAVSGVDEEKGRQESKRLGLDVAPIRDNDRCETIGDDNADYDEARGGSFELMLSPDLDRDEVGRGNGTRLLDDRD